MRWNVTQSISGAGSASSYKLYHKLDGEHHGLLLRTSLFAEEARVNQHNEKENASEVTDARLIAGE